MVHLLLFQVLTDERRYPDVLRYCVVVVVDVFVVQFGLVTKTGTVAAASTLLEIKASAPSFKKMQVDDFLSF